MEVDASPMGPEVRAILEDPKLWSRITKTEFDKKIVGEHETRETIFLCACGRLVENSQESSFNLMVNSASGAGKDYVTSKVLEILPGNALEKRKTISPKVFSYWHNSKFEPDWTWDGKVCYLEDVPNSVLNADPMKLMASSGNGISTIVINNRAVDIVVRGKPVLMITTAASTPNPENLRRFNILNLDESKDQTKEIMKRQAEFAKRGLVPEYDNMIKRALGYLARVKVKVPFAERIYPHFPDNIIIRTAYNRFLDYIKASAALYQFQRDPDEDGYLIATDEDYKRAKVALMKTTSNKTMIPLTKDQKRIIGIFETLERQPYRIADIEPKAPFCAERTLRRRMKELAEFGILKCDSEKEDRKTFLTFSYTGVVDLKLPNSVISDNVDNADNTDNRVKRNQEALKGPKDVSTIDSIDTIVNDIQLTDWPKKGLPDKKARDFLGDKFEEAAKLGLIFEPTPGIWRKI